MNTADRTIQINSILFESNDTEVLVKGTVLKGHMAFETDMLISHSQLNKLVNQLQRQNENLEMSALIQSETMYNNETLYSAELSSVANRHIDLYDLSVLQPIKQIRA